jgi:hypothetical protein
VKTNVDSRKFSPLLFVKMTDRTVDRGAEKGEPDQPKSLKREENPRVPHDALSWRVGENVKFLCCSMLSALAEQVQFTTQQPRERSISPPRQDPSPTDTPNPNQFQNGDSWGEVMIRDREEPMACIVDNASFVVHATECGVERREGYNLQKGRNVGVARGSNPNNGSFDGGRSA